MCVSVPGVALSAQNMVMEAVSWVVRLLDIKLPHRKAAIFFSRSSF